MTSAAVNQSAGGSEILIDRLELGHGFIDGFESRLNDLGDRVDDVHRALGGGELDEILQVRQRLGIGQAEVGQRLPERQGIPWQERIDSQDDGNARSPKLGNGGFPCGNARGGGVIEVAHFVSPERQRDFDSQPR